jgi:putative transport protein
VVLALVIAGTGAIVTTVLAAAIDTLNRVLPEAAPLVSVGYGVSYPYSMIGMVLLIQFLPKLLKRPILVEEKRWLAEKAIEVPGLQARQFRVTNVKIDGKNVSEVNPRRLAQVNISRIKNQ